MSSRSRTLRIDLLRIFALLGAVGIHFIYPVYSRPDFLGGSTWWITNVLSTLARNSIPLFIMISGYLLIPKKESTVQTVKRTFHRLVVPLIFWFGLYTWWENDFLGKPQTTLSILSMLVQSNMFHLYFLAILIGLYLLLPVFRRIVATTSFSDQKKLSVILFGIGILMYVCQYFVLPYQSIVSSFTIWLPYAGFFLWGGVVALHKTPLQKHAMFFITLLVMSSVFTLVLGYFNLQWLGQENRFFWNTSGISYFDHFLSPAVVTMAVSLFTLSMTIQNKKTFAIPTLLQRVITQIARTAFGVYLIHVLVLNVLDFRYGYALELLNQNLFSYLLQRSLLALSISFGVIFIAIRVPFLKRVLGEK